jgi:Holliday junction resolvase RusA-like endonuclease
MRLPYPPSVNKYYIFASKGKVLLTPEARKYKDLVAWTVCASRFNSMIESRAIAWIELYPPDDRCRDTDNPQKAIFDSLEGAGVISNDRLITEHHVKMFPKNPRDGFVYVTIFNENSSEWVRQYLEDK